MNNQEKRIWKKAKPIQHKERARNIREDWIFTNIMPEWKDIVVEDKSPAYITAFLKRRKSTKLPYNEKTKYDFCKEAYEQLLAVMTEHNAREFERALRKVNTSMKYQGYLQMHQVIAEKGIENLTDEQIKTKWLAEKL